MTLIYKNKIAFLIILILILLGLSSCDIIIRFGTNKHPVVNAGPDRNVKVGDLVSITAKGWDEDSDDDKLFYIWWPIEAPENANAIVDMNHDTVSFTPDAAGDYVLIVAVFDGEDQSVPDTIKVSVTN